MKKIIFITNDGNFELGDLAKKHLSSYSIDVAQQLPDKPSAYQAVVLWNYKKIIPDVEKYNNILVFHSSPLPLGKGWAPIYYALAEKRSHHVISLIRAQNQVDTGNILAQASFAISPNVTAKYLRMFDAEISLMMLKQLLDKNQTQLPPGKKQDGNDSYYKKRTPADNEMPRDQTLENLLPHLKACESAHPALVTIEGEQFTLTLEPVHQPEFPKDLQITFFNT